VTAANIDGCGRERSLALFVHLSNEFGPELDSVSLVVVAHDSAGREAHRRDVDENEIREIDRSREWSKPIEFVGCDEPEKWTVWI
jgi:hypothetical protein